MGPGPPMTAYAEQIAFQHPGALSVVASSVERVAEDASESCDWARLKAAETPSLDRQSCLAKDVNVAPPRGARTDLPLVLVAVAASMRSVVQSAWTPVLAKDAAILPHALEKVSRQGHGHVQGAASHCLALASLVVA